MPLRNWQGQPMFVVNTASECGYTPQYAKLQKLWNDYRNSGLVVLGIPCNDFGEQEPGDSDAIDDFCYNNYSVTFPMTQKQSIIGVDAHPLYRGILDEYGPDALPKWNFHKILFNNRGDMVEYWPSNVEPDDTSITNQIARHLQSWIL